MDLLLKAIMRRQLSRAFTTLQSPLASFLMWRQYGRAFTTLPNPHASFISHHENLLSVMDLLLIAIMRRQLSRALISKLYHCRAPSLAS